MVRRFSTVGLGGFGLLSVLLAAWAGIAVFVGPDFGYSVDSAGSWVWNASHAWLHVAPGVAGVVAGLSIMTAGSSLGRAATGGLLAVFAGGWLVIGPVTWPVLVSGGRAFSGASPFHTLAYQVGANLGPGALLILFGAMTMATAATSGGGAQTVARGPDVRGARMAA